MPGSSSTGRQAAATACATSLEALGWSTSILDAAWLGGSHVRAMGTAAEAGARKLLAIPGLHDAFHYASLRTGNQLALRADLITRVWLVPPLRERLERQPVELALSFSPAGASAVSAVAPRYPSMRHVVFCAEASPHRLWIQPNVDLYLVRSAAAEPAVRRFRPDARIRVVAPAVRPEFYRAPAKRTARIGLGVREDCRCVTLVTGSTGAGPLAEIAAALAGAGLTVLAVAGYNTRIERKLRTVAERRPNLLVFGFTDRMPELMAASDVVITTPGGTCMEARTVGRGLLLLDLVQGHGRDDLLYELELGDADVSSTRPVDVVRSALACLARVKPPSASPTRSLAEWEDAFGDALASVLP